MYVFVFLLVIFLIYGTWLLFRAIKAHYDKKSLSSCDALFLSIFGGKRCEAIKLIRDIWKNKETVSKATSFSHDVLYKPKGFLNAGAFGVPSPQKKKSEDAFFASSEISAIGVADGVGSVSKLGLDPSLFSKFIAEVCQASIENHYLREQRDTGSLFLKLDSYITPAKIERKSDEEPFFQTLSGPYSPTKLLNITAKNFSISQNSKIEDKFFGIQSLDAFPSFLGVNQAYEKSKVTGPKGSSTLCVACLTKEYRREESKEIFAIPCTAIDLNFLEDPNFENLREDHVRFVLDVTNIGDSGCMVLRRDEATGIRTIVFRSLDMKHSHNTPCQLSNLNPTCCDPPENAHLYRVEVKKGDLVLLATDGLFDNVWDFELAKVCDGFISPNDVDLVVASQRLGLPKCEEGVNNMIKDLKRATDPVHMARVLGNLAAERGKIFTLKPTVFASNLRMDRLRWTKREYLTPWAANAPIWNENFLFGCRWEGGKPDDVSVVCAWIE
eukprot:GHVP01055326.1.p1 GENE.GHVP01055326.1~~GHVP01055326.1.p1  ORF type:complete len:497 (+),score=84.91 GHVP01055326.1:249-1739(+)